MKRIEETAGRPGGRAASQAFAATCREPRSQAAAACVGGAARPALCALLAIALALGMLFASMAAARPAFAETYDIEAELTDEQRLVEETAAAYNDAVARVDELDQQIADNEDRIDEIERDLPGRRDLAADAVREIYLMQQQGVGIIELLLSSESLGDFLMRFEYLMRVQDSNAAALETLGALQTELEQTREGLKTARAQAEEERAAAETALAEAQEARERAQREAEERAEAERAAAAQAAAEAESEAADAAEGSDAADAADDAETADDGAQPETDGAAESDGGATTAAPSTGGVDWSTDKATFVAQWAGRIDAYLAGSPLAGQGETFASAAWDYGVDPRFSPAISAVESSKGAYCFNSHNAWGWGSMSWGSWEEAIYDHVAGLARGYGYTVTIEGAQKYCPPNWQHWYNSVSANMNMI